MSKKSREKKRRKMQRRGLPGYAGSFADRQGESPAQRALQERIARGGDHYVQDNFIRIMQSSHILRNEPEFRDLYFDLPKTDAVRSRLMKRYEKQLPEVLKKSKDEQHKFYDEVRIEIIDGLTTPAFRQDVLKRLEGLAQRLANGREADKYEMALVLQPMLQQKEIPWGLCGLITAIYEDSAEKADRQFHQAADEFEKMLQRVEHEGDLEKLLALPDESPEIAQAVERLRAQPSLMEELRKGADEAFQEFEEQITNGEVILDLFTPEELQRPLLAIAEYLATNQIDAETADKQEVAKQFAAFIQRAIGEVMTPDRTQKMKDNLQRLSAQWLREKNWQGVLLQGETSSLDTEQPSDNPFIYAAFVSQMKRWRDGQVESRTKTDASAGTANASTPPSSKAEARANSHANLGERVARFLGRGKES